MIPLFSSPPKLHFLCLTCRVTTVNHPLYFIILFFFILDANLMSPFSSKALIADQPTKIMLYLTSEEIYDICCNKVFIYILHLIKINII